MTSPVEDLRRAAVLLRQRAKAATPGPWRYDPDMLDNGAILSDAPDVNPGWGCLVGDTRNLGGEDCRWIATVDPAVGLALADLLDELAVGLEAMEVIFSQDMVNASGATAGRLARLILGEHKPVETVHLPILDGRST